MFDLSVFRGGFGDFQTLAHDADIEQYVYCIFGPEGNVESYKMIVGWTMLPADVLLHVIDVEGTEENFDIQAHIEKHGIQLVLLRDFVGPYGCEIHQDFQLDSSSENKSE